MSSCCILQCGAKKYKNAPLITLHRFPRNEGLRRKWLDAIGIENINPRHKNWFVCSLHFKESNFNKTLDVVRLRDNVIPSISLPVNKQKINVLCERQNIHKSTRTLTSSELASIHVPVIKENLETYQEIPVSSKKVNIPPVHLLDQELQLKFPKVQTEKIKNLVGICNKQRLKIERLNERVRRQNKKIANLNNILHDLKEKNQVDGEQIVLLEECAGPKDFLKRQVAKSKGLPLTQKYSLELRKFALTLHFLSPRAS